MSAAFAPLCGADLIHTSHQSATAQRVALISAGPSGALTRSLPLLRPSSIPCLSHQVLTSVTSHLASVASLLPHQIPCWVAPCAVCCSAIPISIQFTNSNHIEMYQAVSQCTILYLAVLERCYVQLQCCRFLLTPDWQTNPDSAAREMAVEPETVCLA